MSRKDQIDQIFTGYLNRKGVKKEIANLVTDLTLADVDILLDKIERIGDVDDYVNDLEANAPAERFFAFVDLISALIIFLGPEEVKKACGRSASKSRYMPWVIKFVQDERFHNQVKQQLPAKFR